ncbi:site-specific integrase [Desulfuromonas sp. TF]|uniref:tyrosine-type recombinase/integrase n=1 Tax=Desulfuromonas sp. TF TaxID=1232410 RepID=UPI00048521BB|nr:site-specific integrase [Desulfuromonas sp. TF]
MSVYKRGKVFYMNFTLNGIRVFKSTGMTTKREAKAIENTERHRLLKESRQSPQEKRSKTLLLDAVELTYEAKWKHGKDSTRSYRRACNLAELIGNVPVGKIDEDTVQQLTRNLEGRGSKNATINRYLASLKTILKQMKQQTDFIHLRKEPKGRIRVLSKEEEQEVLKLLRQDHGGRRIYYAEFADLVEVLLGTGMRLSEGLELLYLDVNYASGMIHIWRNKGDRPRSVPMTKKVRSILHARQKANPEKPFTLKEHQAESAWAWIRKQIGLQGDKEFVIHSATRHTYASRLANKGVDIFTIKELLGHSSITTSMIYMHLDPSKLAHAVAVLEEESEE